MDPYRSNPPCGFDQFEGLYKDQLGKLSDSGQASSATVKIRSAIRRVMSDAKYSGFFFGMAIWWGVDGILNPWMPSAVMLCASAIFGMVAFTHRDAARVDANLLESSASTWDELRDTDESEEP